MTPDLYPDPYPDLAGAELLGTASDSDDGAPVDRPELDEADSRLLDALSQPQPPVVAAVEDEPRTVRAARADRIASRGARGGRSPLAPVFQEPTD